MSVSHSRSTMLLSLVVVASFAIAAHPAAAAKRKVESDRCVDKQGETRFVGTNRIFYKRVSRKRWKLIKAEYQLNPSDRVGDKSNVNVKIFNGRTWWPGPGETTWKSPDSLAGDGNWHLLRRFGFRVKRRYSSVHFHNIFDLGASGDPDCWTRIDL